MTTDREDMAVIALIAKALLPEFERELTEAELKAIVQHEILLFPQDEIMLRNMNPLAFLEDAGRPSGQIIQFIPEEKYDMAVGFNREGKGATLPDDASDKIKAMRAKIIEKLRARKEDESK